MSEPTKSVVTIEQPSQPDTWTPVVAELARKGNLEAVKEIINLRNAEYDREARRLFAVDLVQMKPHLPKVARKAYNEQTKKHYATLDDINKEVDPILEQYGFATSTKVIEQTDTSVTVVAQLWHRGGHMEQNQVTMPLDRTGIAGSVNKTGPHALSSSITYAKRVAVCALLNISTGDDKDGNREEEAKLITIEQAADIDVRVRALGEDYYKRFMAWIKLRATTEIPASKYKDVMAVLTKAEQEAKAKK